MSYTNYNFQKTYVNYPSFQTQIIYWVNPFREGNKETLFDEIRIRVSTISHINGTEYYEDHIINEYCIIEGYNIQEIIDNLIHNIKENM